MLKRFVMFGVLVLLALTTQGVVAQDGGSQTGSRDLATKLAAYISQPDFAAASWGIKVVSLDSGRQIFAHDADKLMIPASTGKLFTGALALATFGERHRVPTSLFATGKPDRSGTLRGDLILYGYGDPTLGTTGRTQWPDQLAAELGKSGVRRVHGDVIADDSYDLQSWFGAPISTLSIGENIVRVTVSPGKAVDDPAVIAFQPAYAALDLANSLRTVARGKRNDINLYRAPGSSTLAAFGSIALGTDAQGYRISIADPALLAGNLMSDALIRRGIDFDGKVRVAHWPRRDGPLKPEKLQHVADVWSPPLAEIVHSGLKRSQNLYLQNLLLMVGSKFAFDQAPEDEGATLPFRTTEDWGIRAMQKWLIDVGAPKSVVLMEEGAGLSRKDLTTPAALTGLLIYAARQPWGATFRDSLAIAGVDGSLRARMHKTPAEDTVQAKSGSMSYTDALAGYVTTKAGENLAFALMLNNYVPQPPPRGGKRLRGRDAMDAIAILLAESTEKVGTPVISSPAAVGSASGH